MRPIGMLPPGQSPNGPVQTAQERIARLADLRRQRRQAIRSRAREHQHRRWRTTTHPWRIARTAKWATTGAWTPTRRINAADAGVWCSAQCPSRAEPTGFWSRAAVEFARIDPQTMQDVKREVGLGGKDINQLSLEEKVISLTHFL